MAGGKKPLKDSDKCVGPPVIPPHLGKGARLCVRGAGGQGKDPGAESIRSVSRSAVRPSQPGKHVDVFGHDCLRVPLRKLPVISRSLSAATV